MRQVLFRIPGLGLPVFGYGLMLVVGLFVALAVASRLARQRGQSSETMSDLLMWMTVPGILTARLFYFVQYHDQFDHWWQFFVVWKGGLVAFGSIVGATAGLLIFSYRTKLSVLWLLDVIAPAIGLAFAFGRIGCLLNGCCYGDYCEQPIGIRFPANSPAHIRLVERGLQSPLGFIVDDGRRIVVVEPESDARRKGIRVGDVVVSVNDEPTADGRQLHQKLVELTLVPDPRPFTITVRRGDTDATVSLRAARSLPLHPTQIYSSVNGLVLFFFLGSYFPLRHREGEVFALLAILYSISRFLIEFLRYDETPFRFDGLTISQNISLLVIVIGVALWFHTKPLKSGETGG